MQITERAPGDVEQLGRLIDGERRADRRDRLRVALLALQGFEKLQIAEILGVATSTVEYWAYAYRDRGIEALQGKVRTGRTAKITGEQARRLSNASTQDRLRATGSAPFAARTSSESPGRNSG